MVYSWVAKQMIASPLCVFDPTQCLKGVSVLAISFAEHSFNTRMSGCKLITASRFFSNPILQFQETIRILAQPLVTPTRSIRCKKKRPLPLKEYRREGCPCHPAARPPSQIPHPHGLISTPRHRALFFTSPFSLILLSLPQTPCGQPHKNHPP